MPNSPVTFHILTFFVHHKTPTHQLKLGLLYTCVHGIVFIDQPLL